MLTIGKLGAGQERYYTEKVAEGAEDYYSGEGEAAGRWLGDGAADLGLSGEVGPEQLTAMLTGLHPATGEPLGLRAVHGRGPVPGFDLTFSAPKSVSLLWALGGPEAGAEVEAAHAASVNAALHYMQANACWTRRGAGGHEFVHGNGFLAAAYQHRSSRAGDPQLHTHTLIANFTRCPDGRFLRLYHPAIYEQAKTAGYLYEAQLRHELTRRLGVRWAETRNGIAEIEGFADSHLREFSTRRQQILEAAGEEASARARQIANLTTRKGKEIEVVAGSLRERWVERAQEIGLTEEVFERVLGARESVEVQRITVAEIDREVTAHASHFERRDAIQAVAQLSPAGAPAAAVEKAADAYLRSQGVIRISATDRAERFTTRRIWELERRALASAGEMASLGDRAVAGERIAANVISLRPSLKDDQREMVGRLLTGGEGIVVVIGEAGSGKSFATVAAAEGWEAAEIGLRVAAPTWRAANVLRSEGLDATSIARLLVELDRAAEAGRGGLERGSVLLVDEAGMVDSATLARLIEHAREAEAKLVLVGDYEQLAEIEAGGLFRAIAERQGAIQLSEVVRHRHEADREGARLIREGEGREAIALYRSENRVTIAAHPEERRELMVAEWKESFLAGEDAVMVAKRNAEVERLNEGARAAMREAGRLGAAEIEVGGAPFAVGDQVITRVNDQSLHIYNRERWRIEEVDVATRSVVLSGIDQGRMVEVGAEYLARTNPRGDAPALQHAYAVTAYSAQGSTVDRAFVAVDPSMDKQELYVAASRSREQTYLYATPEVQAEREEISPRSAYLRNGIPHIAEAAERDRSQRAAHDLIELRALPDSELANLREELRPLAREEARIEIERKDLERRVDDLKGCFAELDRRREQVPDLPRRQRRAERQEIEHSEAAYGARLAEASEELSQLPPTDHGAREQIEAIEALREERSRQVLLAARICPPDYVVAELGERPIGHYERSAWDRGVREIEDYRREHDITDPGRALGPMPDPDHEARWEHDQAERTLHEAQREIDPSHVIDHSHDLADGFDLGL